MPTKITYSVPERSPSVPDWRTLAACVREDPELFHPIGSGAPVDAQVSAAKRVCARCPVEQSCRSWAMWALPYGIAGGLTAEERQDERELRALAALDAPPEPEREPNPLDDLSPEALAAALATGPRDAVPEGTPLRVRSELARSRLFTEFLGSRKSSSPGGVRWSDAGREALSAFRERERRGTRVTEQLGLPIGVSS